MKEATRAPMYACIYHALCDIARNNGYSLAIHGTVTSDLDIIAIPWTDKAVDKDILKEALIERCIVYGYSGSSDKWTNKPHGRKAINLYTSAGCKIDLSVMPKKTRNKKE